MGMIKNLSILFFTVLFSCTSNPFWEDNPSKKITIQGNVMAESKVSDIPIFVFIEGLNVYSQTDTSGFFSIELPNLELETGNFSGAVKVFYYMHNYKIAYSTLYITNGRLTRSQTDFDEDGVLIETVFLKKLLSLDFSLNGSWNRSSGDSLRFSLKLTSFGEPVRFISYVNVIPNPRRDIPSGVLLKSMQNSVVYYDKNDADIIVRIDISSNDTVLLDYNISADGFFPFEVNDYISMDQQIMESGLYYVLPYIFVIQENIPDEMFLYMGISNAQNISVGHLDMPIDMPSKTILIQ